MPPAIAANITTDSAPLSSMATLLEGYNRFRKDGYQKHLKNKLEHLSNEGQSPLAMVLGCCDSRADPAIVFDTEPGDIFTCRNIANIVPPYTPDGGHHGTCAAIEYAVTALKVPLLIVMGHSQCGGAAHALKICSRQLGKSDSVKSLPLEEAADKQPSFIDRWCALAKEPVCRVCEAFDQDVRTRELEQELVRHSIRNLMTHPFVRDAVEAGELELRGAFFNIFNAKLKILGEDNRFVEVTSKDALTPTPISNGNGKVSRKRPMEEQLVKSAVVSA